MIKLLILILLFFSFFELNAWNDVFDSNIQLEEINQYSIDNFQESQEEILDEQEEKIEEEKVENISWMYRFDRQARKNIIENFKKEKKRNIFQSSNIKFTESDLSVFKKEQRIQNYERILFNIQSSTQQYTQKRDNLLLRIDSLEETLKAIDRDIDETLRNINNLNQSIISKVRAIKETKDNILNKSQEIKEMTWLLLEYIAHIYKKYNL